MKILRGNHLNRLHTLLLIIGFMLLGSKGFGQGIVVRGTVVASTGEPLPGVTVVEKNRDNRQVNGTLTGVNGQYQIFVSDVSNSLSFTFIGFQQVTRPVGSQSVINVTMSEDVTELEGVTIVGVAAKPPVETGGFLSIPQRDQTAATTTLKMVEFENIPATSLDQVLEGQVSGLLISMNSGDPGSGSSIQIRGATSLGLGSKPLIVVDDVPFKTNEIVDVNNPEGLSELISISTSDIESITVLKDAGATALYGSDGANGVIVIKTKRGSNVNPRVTINSVTTLRYPQRPIPMLNGDEYKTMILEGYQNRYGTDIDLTTSPIRNLFLEPTALDYENYNNNTDWTDQINMIRGFGQQLFGSVVGGGEAAGYNLSLGYNHDEGPAIGTDYSRVTGRFNFDYKISDKLLFVSDISFASESKTSTYETTSSLALIKSPVLPVFTEDIYGKPLSTFFFPGTNGFQGNVKNPVALIYNALSTNNGKRLDGKISVRYNPFKGVRFNSVVAITNQTLLQDKFLPHSATGVDFYRLNNIYLIANNQVNTGSIIPKNAFDLYFKSDLIYTYTKGKHTLQALLSSIYEDRSSRAITLDGTNMPSEYLTSPYLTDILNTISSTKYLQRTFKLVGQAVYTFDDRYSIQGILNRNGDSAFGENNRYGLFPSVSGFWRPSSEPFLKERFTWLDQFKIRGSWGISGRAPTSSAANAFTFSANAPFIDIIGVNPDNIELVNLRWEKTTSTNVGVDLSVFKGKISFTGDYSRGITRDLLQNIPISPTSGFEIVQTNFGTIRNNVFEGALTGQFNIKQKLEITASFNVSTVHGKVLELPNNEPVIRDNVLDNDKYITLVNVGDAPGTFYGLRYLGVYRYDEDAFAKDADGNFLYDFAGEKVPVRWNNQEGEVFTGGDAHYDDINHDGIINKQDVVAIGNAIPDYFGGLYLRVKYNRQWELFANFSYIYKFDIINGGMMKSTNMYNNDNQSTIVLRRWRKQGDGLGEPTDIPRALYGTGHNWVGSDRFIEDGSFFKGNTISLSYNLSRAMLEKVKFRSAKVALTVSNAFIITKYSGVDPSVSLNSNNPFYVGRDNSLTPAPIIYSLGIWLIF